eukprot:5489486-Prymnesium_polylepis.1
MAPLRTALLLGALVAGGEALPSAQRGPTKPTKPALKPRSCVRLSAAGPLLVAEASAGSAVAARL